MIMFWIGILIMTSTTAGNGRLGNQIIRNIAVSFIAEKFDLYVDYSSKDIIDNLGIPLYCGSRTFPTTIELNDDNYMSILNAETLNSNLYPNNAYFQSKQIIDLIYKYLRSEKVMSSIKKRNEYKHLYEENNNCVYMHVRLGDVVKYSPGASYYIKALREIEDKHGEIDMVNVSTDSPDHEIIRLIKEAHPNVKLINTKEEYTIKYAITHKRVIVSHGTFSAIIGYLCNEVYYPCEKEKWYGELSVNEWKWL